MEKGKIEYKFEIPGKLPCLNDYIASMNRNRFKGNQMKQDYMTVVEIYAIRCFGNLRIGKPVDIVYRFYEKNQRRDKDNIAGFAHKVIQDALVNIGILKNDGWKWVRNFRDEFYIDKANPRIEVTLIEVEE